MENPKTVKTNPDQAEGEVSKIDEALERSAQAEKEQPDKKRSSQLDSKDLEKAG